MTTNKKNASAQDEGFLFSIEVLVKGKTNGHALETLTHLLNHDAVVDYRVLKGITLGQVIDAAIEMAEKNKKTAATSKRNEQTDSTPSKATPKSKPVEYPIVEPIKQYIEDRKLVRLTVVKGKGVKLSIPCRILNYDQASSSITVYHVDEKKVYTFQLSEIDDLVSS